MPPLSHHVSRLILSFIDTSNDELAMAHTCISLALASTAHYDSMKSDEDINAQLFPYVGATCDKGLLSLFVSRCFSLNLCLRWVLVWIVLWGVRAHARVRMWMCVCV